MLLLLIRELCAALQSPGMDSQSSDLEGHYRIPLLGDFADLLGCPDPGIQSPDGTHIILPGQTSPCI